MPEYNRVWWNQIILADTCCFGEYRCRKCNRRWMSGNSWKGYGQKCKSCKKNYVLPHKLRPLETPDGLNKCDPKKMHLRELCQKCNDLGHFCGEDRK